jgi:CCR4-NOT transcriptional regulation complex NOT5 subunit
MGFVLSVQEEDFEEDEGIYEDLHLDEEEDGLGVLQDHDDNLSESDMQSVSEGKSKLYVNQPLVFQRTNLSS